MGIQVELKHGRRWWYVVVDFGDGSNPVSKGPMTEAEAREMAAELEADAAQAEGVVLRDKSVEEEQADARIGAAIVALGFLLTVGSIAGAVAWWLQ